MQVDARTQAGLLTLCVTAHDLTALVVPDLGAKIASLTWQGRELLAKNAYKPLRPARFAAPYAEFDASGFDECLPTIGPCLYPEVPWLGVEAPDHGEVWSIPWAWDATPEALHLSCRSPRFRYDFHKTLSVPAPGCLRLRYALHNRGDHPFKFLWSAHPLLALRPGLRICLPRGVRVLVDWSRDERLGRLLDEHPWPHTTEKSGQAADLSLILPETAGLVDKLYTTRLPEGWCALHDEATGEYAAFLFSPKVIPYVGLSINLGGWPVESPSYYNLGLEPCLGYPDRLDLAIERGAYALAGPGERLAWEMDLCVGAAFDLPAEIARLRSARVPAGEVPQPGARQ
jgi:hypothetical protein